MQNDEQATEFLLKRHVEAGENHWFTCGLCDDEGVEYDNFYMRVNA